MEMQYGASGCPYAFVRFVVGVRCTPSTLKQLGYAAKGGGFSALHHALHMAECFTLCRGQAGKVGIE